MAFQQREVLRLLRERRRIGLSSVEAVAFQILRLPNRISEIRKRGWIIQSKRERCGCLRYWLVAEPESPKPLPVYEERTRAIEAEVAPLFVGVRS